MFKPSYKINVIKVLIKIDTATYISQIQIIDPILKKKTCLPNVHDHIFTENDDSKFLFSLMGRITLPQYLQNTIWCTLCLQKMLRRVLSDRGAVFFVSPSHVCNLRTRLSTNWDEVTVTLFIFFKSKYTWTL